MEIIKDKQGTIILKGDLVVSNIEAIYSSLDSLLEESSREIVLDLSGVEEIDIAGLQLLYSLKRTFETDGSLLINAVNAPIREIMDLSGFNVALKEALP